MWINTSIFENENPPKPVSVDKVGFRSDFSVLLGVLISYNIFSALHKEHDERRLHSRFIATLLQPRGRHGQKTKFLEIFASHACDDKKFIVNDSVLVFPKESDRKENNNIDIMVLNRDEDQCMIIENKINAGDSNLISGGQIERYIDHVIRKEGIPLENIWVVYLTMDGHEPSNESVGKHKNLKLLTYCNYENLIIPWLDECVKHAVNQPYLRESISQYKKLIEKMTGNSASTEERVSYRELIGSSEENMKTTKKLIENFKHVKWHSVFDFWESLQRLIENDSFKLQKPFNTDSIHNQKSNNCITDLTHYETYRKGQRSKQSCKINFITKQRILISVRFSADYGHFYFGVPKKANSDTHFAKVFSDLVTDHQEYIETDWMFVSKIFKNDIKFNDFNNDITFSLIKAEKNKEFAQNSFIEIKELTERITEKIGTIEEGGFPKN